MRMKKLFVTTFGQSDGLRGRLTDKGRAQSERLANKLAPFVENETVYIFSPSYNGPIHETANLVRARLKNVAKATFLLYVNDDSMSNIWRILDMIYHYQNDIIVLIMNPTEINRFTTYFCEDNKIPVSLKMRLGYCCGYAIDCVAKNCSLIDLAQPAEED